MLNQVEKKLPIRDSITSLSNQPAITGPALRPAGAE
jgi:hypothetical protein